MNVPFTTWSASAEQPATGRAARWILLLACGLAWFAVCPNRAAAQSLQLRAAFNDVDDSTADRADSAAGKVRIASGPKLGIQQPLSVAQAPAKKNAAPATTPRQSPQLMPSQTPEADSSDTTEELPAQELKAKLPMSGAEAVDGLLLAEHKGLITLIVRDKSLSQVLALIAQTQKLNIVAANDIDALISITLRDVPLEEALTAILSVANYTWVKRNNIILITSLTDATNLPADVQGRQIQVFDLDFTSAALVAETVKNFLSPIGKVSIGASSPTNNRLTQERVVVEDLSEPLARIADYIAQVDQPPRQVLIEAHVLDVKLNDTNSCGVDLNAFGLNTVMGGVPRLATNVLAPNAPSAVVATLGNNDLGAIIKLIQDTTDAKTLGSPKLLVLNEQEARIQVGETLYYSQVTTTETSTQQGAGSVEAGTILRLTPRITRDHRVLLRVAPEVSKPLGTGSNGLPPNMTKTTLETDVILNDNEGMVIGGLINDVDETIQKKIPYLGNVKNIGFLFRQSTVRKERHEIIVALVPRIQPYNCEYQDFEQGELVKAGVPLMHGALHRTDRPWDPILPDGKRVSYPLIPKKYRPRGHYYDLGPKYAIPPTPLPTQQMCEEPCAEQGHIWSSDEVQRQPERVDFHETEIISDQQ